MTLLFALLIAALLPHSQFTISSAVSVDSTAHTAVLPLHRGTANGRDVWYIVTDASDAATARRFGVNFAPALASIGIAATQTATQNARGEFAFAGAPDFGAARTAKTPGGVADANYSPFVRVRGIPGVLNAPIVATGDGPFDVTAHTDTEDRVLAVDLKAQTVTLTLARGFFEGKPVYYLSPDASAAGPASIERATYVPRLAKANAAAEIPIGVVADGPQSGSAPQGLAYLTNRTPLWSDATLANAATIGSPFNVLSVAPDLAHPFAPNGYSPLWNAVVVGAPQHARLTSYAQIARIGKDAGFAVNCPVVAYGDASTSGY